MHVDKVQPLFPQAAFTQTVNLKPYPEFTTYKQGETVKFQFPAVGHIVPGSLGLDFNVQLVRKNLSRQTLTIEKRVNGPSFTQTNRLNLKVGAAPVTFFEIATGTYTSASDFCAALLTAWQTVEPTMQSITYNATTNLFTYTYSAHAVNTEIQNFSLNGKSTLAFILGFNRTANVVWAGGTLVFTSSPPAGLFSDMNLPKLSYNLRRESLTIDGGASRTLFSKNYVHWADLCLAVMTAIQDPNVAGSRNDVCIYYNNNLFVAESYGAAPADAFTLANISFNELTMFPADGVATVVAGLYTLISNINVGVLFNDLFTNPRFQCNILSCFQRAYVRYNYDLVIEDIQQFGRIQRMLTELNANFDKQISEGAVLSNIAPWQVRLDVASQMELSPQSFSTRLPIGFFNQEECCIPLKYMKDRALMLDLTLRNDLECFVMDSEYLDQWELQYSNFTLRYDIIEYPPEQEAILYKSIQEGLHIPFVSWTWDVKNIGNIKEETDFRYPYIGCALFMIGGLFADQSHVIMDSDCTFSFGQPSLLLPWGTNGVAYSVTTPSSDSYVKKYYGLVDDLIVPETGVDVHSNYVPSIQITSASSAFDFALKTLSKTIDNPGQGVNPYRWAHPYQQTRTNSEIASSGYVTYLSSTGSPFSPPIANRDVYIGFSTIPFQGRQTNACPQFYFLLDFINPQHNQQVGTNLDEKNIVQLHTEFNRAYQNSGVSLHSFLAHRREFVLSDFCNAAVLH